MLRRVASTVGAWGALVLMAVSCGGGGAHCVAGSTQACLCSAGVSGVQVCASDGSYGACSCGADAGVDGGGHDAGADAGCGAAEDADSDGHRSMACGGDDCDDTDPNRYPGNVEVCDAAGHDEDCDPATLGPDHDGDGLASTACCDTQPSGALLCGTDCDDTRAFVNPTAPEVCDGIDDDCDGMIDEGIVSSTFYPDCDGDTFGAPGSAGTMMMGCSMPTMPPAVCGGGGGWSVFTTDCDDTNAMVHPGATEVCNGVDDDCSGAADETFACVRGSTGPCTTSCSTTGTGTCSATCTLACAPPAEVCDHVDQDCNGIVDDGAAHAWRDHAHSMFDGAYRVVTLAVSDGWVVVAQLTSTPTAGAIEAVHVALDGTLGTPVQVNPTHLAQDFDAASDGTNVYVEWWTGSAVYGASAAAAPTLSFGAETSVPFMAASGTAFVELAISGSTLMYAIAYGTTIYGLTTTTTFTSPSALGTLASTFGAGGRNYDVEPLGSGFVLVWEQWLGGTSTTNDIHVQPVDATGTPALAGTLWLAGATGGGTIATVAAARSGDYVLVAYSIAVGSPRLDALVLHYDAAAMSFTPTGASVSLSGLSSSTARDPFNASSDGATFALGWLRNETGGGTSVQALWMATDGSVLVDTTRVGVAYPEPGACTPTPCALATTGHAAAIAPGGGGRLLLTGTRSVAAHSFLYDCP